MKNHFKKYWHLYLAFILFIMGMFYIRRAYTYEITYYSYTYENPIAIRHISMYEDLVYEECHTNRQKCQFHKENGERCYKDAKERSWWMPEISDRDKARYCFTNIGLLLIPGSSKSKLITTLVSSLIQYGLDCTDEWHYINNKLYWSQYHYEMMEFYENLVRNGYN